MIFDLNLTENVHFFSTDKRRILNENAGTTFRRAHIKNRETKVSSHFFENRNLDERIKISFFPPLLVFGRKKSPENLIVFTPRPFRFLILIVNSIAATTTDRSRPSARITKIPPIFAKPNSEAMPLRLSS